MSLSCFRINTYISVDSKGLTAMLDFGAPGPIYRRPKPASGSGRYGLRSDAKKKMRQLGCRSGDFTWLFPRIIIAKFGLGSREKRDRNKDNAETQRALRFRGEEPMNGTLLMRGSCYLCSR